MKLNKTSIKWKDFGDYIMLSAPIFFDFFKCINHIKKSEIKILCNVKCNYLTKLVKINNEYFILKIGSFNQSLKVYFLNKAPNKNEKKHIAKHVWHMFDLDAALTEFYNIFSNDPVLSEFITKFKGLRIIKTNNVFEALCWAIMGQQINLNFAYKLKTRFVENYGECITYNGEKYYLFPSWDKIARLETNELRQMQLSTRKAEYIIGIAKLFKKQVLQSIINKNNDYERLKNELIKIRGVGAWTADYAIIQSSNLTEAFPINDIGIHNSLKEILKLDTKPSLDYIRKMIKKWGKWKSYAAFYIWENLGEYD